MNRAFRVERIRDEKYEKITFGISITTNVTLTPYDILNLEIHLESGGTYPFLDEELKIFQVFVSVFTMICRL